MLPIQVMPTCLQPSHLLPKADTRPFNQSEPLECLYSHRRASISYHSALVILCISPSLEAYCFICALNSAQPAAPNKASVTSSHIRDLYFKLTERIMIMEEEVPLFCIERKSMRSCHGNGVFGEYANILRIKQKHFGAAHLCQEFYAHNIHPNYYSY